MTIGNYKILKDCLRNKKNFNRCYEEDTFYKPLDIELRLLYKCNAKCIMCGVESYYHENKDILKEQMSIEKVRDIIDELWDLGTKQLTLSGGEITLFKGLDQIISYGVSKGITIAMNTNGYLVTRAMIDKLYESGIDSITFSLDSPNAEIHDEIRGLPGSFKRIIEAIEYINTVNKLSKHKIYVFINCVLLKTNIDSLKGFRKLLEQIKVDHLNFSPASIDTKWDQWTTHREDLRISNEDVMKLKKETIPFINEGNFSFKLTDPFGDTINEIERNRHVIFTERATNCYVPYIHLVIQPNGDILPCCYSPDDYIIGNIFKSSIKNLLNSDKYNLFRHQLKQSKLPMCQSCKQYNFINNKLNEMRGD